MTRNLSAVGFKSIEKRRKEISEILRSITLLPDNFYCHKNLVEQYGYTGDDYGLIIYGTRQDNDTVKVRRWNTFARSEEPIHIELVDFERFPNGDVFAFCEDMETGQEFEFRLNNVTEYNNYVRETGSRNLYSASANVAGLAEIGNILFPIKKDEEYIRNREEETRIRHDLRTRAREGVVDAERELFEYTSQLSESVHERLKTEDLLSVFESYMLPYGDKDGSFALLGEVLSFKNSRNRITRETVCSLKLNVAGVIINVLINERDLIGLPMIGMRFMGVCALQGTVDFGSGRE